MICDTGTEALNATETVAAEAGLEKWPKN